MLEGAWGTFAIVGVIVLGAAIAWAMYRNKEDGTARGVERSEQGSRDLYERESEHEIAEERREEAAGRDAAGPDPRLDGGADGR